MRQRVFTPRRKPLSDATHGFSQLIGDDEDYGTIRTWLAEEGSHPYEGLIAAFQPVLDRDVYNLTITCFSCEHTWESGISGVEIWNNRHSWLWVYNWLTPFLRSIVSAPCFKLTLFAELAEWLTERAAQAGPLGVTYSELLDEAVEMHLCAPSDVDVVLERLGFLPHAALYVPGGAVGVQLHGTRLIPSPDTTIRLPKGHPSYHEEEE
jgi:hypothetical protein